VVIRILSLFVLACSLTASAESPEINYMLHCRGCHLEDGSGSPGAVPAIDGVLAKFLAVEGGREYLVRVPGSALSTLDDRQLADLLNWMIQRFGPDDEARQAIPYTAVEVARLRTPLVDVAGVRGRLLERIEERDSSSVAPRALDAAN
jgi:hypothetical protein